MIESNHKTLSISSQCDLLGVPRSTYYYRPIPETDYNLTLMREIDLLYLDHPYYGRRLMTGALKLKGFNVNPKRVLRLMKQMCIQAIYPKPKVRTTIPGNIRFPYLLKNIEINTVNQAWGTDITYIPVDGGFLYLVAYLDLYSRYVLSWKISNSLDTSFCLEALEMSLKHGHPDIINSDQGVQYTSQAYIDFVRSQNIKASMSGKGKCWDNIFVERLWRSLKCEEVYLKRYENHLEAINSIGSYINHYNNCRPHSALNYKTPREIYQGI